MKNEFIYIKSARELVRKSMFTGKNVNILYGILHNRVYVAQGLKVIELDITTFAEGIDVDLRVAQILLAGEFTTIETATDEFHRQEGIELEKEIAKVTIDEDEYLRLLNIEKLYNDIVFEEYEEYIEDEEESTDEEPEEYIEMSDKIVADNCEKELAKLDDEELVSLKEIEEER